MEIKIPKEIKSFTENVVGTFTLRQLIAVSISMVLAVVIFVYIPYSQIVKVIIGVTLIVPFMLFGFYEYNGMKAEELLVVIFNHIFSNKQLKCRPNSLYEFIILERNNNATNSKNDENKHKKLSQNS